MQYCLRRLLLIPFSEGVHSKWTGLFCHSDLIPAVDQLGAKRVKEVGRHIQAKHRTLVLEGP